ncbi:MAG: hypothetical protein ACC628_02765 [Pirellulaceae bacterium]
MPEWQARNIIPDEEIPPRAKTDEPRRSGMFYWRDLFSARQLLGHYTSVEVFHDLVDELREGNDGEIAELDLAALAYITFALDKLLNYNAKLVRWHSNREVVAGVFDRHDFAFLWSFAELAPTVVGLGYDWAVKQTGKSLAELVKLTESEGLSRPMLADTVSWEEIEPKVQAAVRERIAEFQEAGIGGIDLYLASFGPALQVFSESWPLQRGRPVQQPTDWKEKVDGEWDAYAVRPEDALDAARREVKRWRMEQLATVKRQHHLDPLTEWYVLAWDAFRAPRFPSDESLRLSRVVGLDFDREVKNHICEIKSGDVILWDSKTRKAKGKLGPIGDEVMLDTLHHAAVTAQEQNTGAAAQLIEEAGLTGDATLLTALEGLLNVLPPVADTGGKKKDEHLAAANSDFEALEKLRRLAFAEEVPPPAGRPVATCVRPIGEQR